MTRIERSIEIRAPPNKIWPLLFWDRLPEWNLYIKKAEYTSKKRAGVGATAHVTGEAEGQKFEYDAEVTEYVENERAAYRSTRGDWTAFGSVTLKPTEAGTKVTMVTNYEMPYSILGKIIDKLKVRKSMGKGHERALENLKSIVEK